MPVLVTPDAVNAEELSGLFASPSGRGQAALPDPMHESGGALATLEHALARVLLSVVRDQHDEAEATRTAIAQRLRGRAGGGSGGPFDGIFARVSLADLRAALDRLLAIGWLEMDPARRGLRVTEDGAAVLAGAEAGVGAGLARALLGVRPASGLERALRALRTARASALGVPAYRILTDRTLIEVAAARPVTLRALAAIPGVGPVTLSEHGEALIGVVRTFLPAG